MKNDIKDILLILYDFGIKYILAGGVASVIHGVERLTLDIDISLDMQKENLLKFLEAMKELRLTPRAPVPPEIITDEDARNAMLTEKNAFVFTFIDVNNPLRQLDIFLSPELQYSKLFNDSISIEIESRKIQVVSKKQLLEMKKNITPLRPKDKMDIEILESLQ